MTYMLDVSKIKKKTYIVDIYHYILEINTSNSYKKIHCTTIEINTSNSWDRYTLSY